MRAASLVLRLAGPLQSWGDRSQFNRRQTGAEPTKSGIVGLLAAAQGRRRGEPIDDLVRLRLGVRTDQPGSLLRDYHTVGDYRGVPLLSAQVDAHGRQRPAGHKTTHVTERFYLQDAVFVAAVAGPAPLLAQLVEAVRRPAFPLALGRRSCPPTLPLLLVPATRYRAVSSADLWDGDPAHVLDVVPWQLSAARRVGPGRRVGPAGVVGPAPAPMIVDLPTVIDADANSAGADADSADAESAGPAAATEVRADVPRSFDPALRSFATRRVRLGWARVETTFGSGDTDDDPGSRDLHDPFALLRW